jgi:hypothetical protein
MRRKKVELWVIVWGLRKGIEGSTVRRQLIHGTVTENGNPTSAKLPADHVFQRHNVSAYSYWRVQRLAENLCVTLSPSHAIHNTFPKLLDDPKTTMTMYLSKTGSILVAIICLFGTSQASKDDSYYIAGTGNPNVNEEMYWKDAENVLQDLSKFSALYVQYHHCAWTWMHTADSGNDVDENDYWYMGKVPPMGANVAFSLYGRLKGKSFSGCDGTTFINSFYTDTGFTQFVEAMYYASVPYFYSSSSSKYTAQCQGGYGVGCDYTNGFAVHKYASNTCDPRNATAVTDTMYDLNNAMKQVQCIKIYDSSSYQYSSNGNGDGDDDLYSGTALELLKYSSSCFYQNMWSPDGECPDPYGKIQYYQSNFAKGIQKSKLSTPYELYKKESLYNEKINKGKNMISTGLSLVGISAVLAVVATIYLNCVAPAGTATKPKPSHRKRSRLPRRSGDDLSTCPSVQSNASGAPELF